MTLESLRNEKKISQEELAQKIGISQVAICRYENGTRTPKPEIAVKLKEFFGITTEEMWDTFYGKEV